MATADVPWVGKASPSLSGIMQDCSDVTSACSEQHQNYRIRHAATTAAVLLQRRLCCPFVIDRVRVTSGCCSYSSEVISHAGTALGAVRDRRHVGVIGRAVQCRAGAAVIAAEIALHRPTLECHHRRGSMTSAAAVDDATSSSLCSAAQHAFSLSLTARTDMLCCIGLYCMHVLGQNLVCSPILFTGESPPSHYRSVFITHQTLIRFYRCNTAKKQKGHKTYNTVLSISAARTTESGDTDIRKVIASFGKMLPKTLCVFETCK